MQQAERAFKTPIMIPPVWLVLSLLLMLALDRWVPVFQLWDQAVGNIGKFFIVSGLALDGWGVLRFLLVKTGLVPFTPVTRLVKSGPYRFSRNPMYIGMLLMLLGVAIVLGTVSPFIVLPLFFLVLRNRFVIPEEAMLEQVLGKSYLQYKQETRRWI